MIRKFTRNRKIYPNEDSALKLIYMAIREASQRWTMPVRHWKEALNHFAIMFEGRLPESVENNVPAADTEILTGPNARCLSMFNTLRCAKCSDRLPRRFSHNEVLLQFWVRNASVAYLIQGRKHGLSEHAGYQNGSPL